MTNAKQGLTLRNQLRKQDHFMAGFRSGMNGGHNRPTGLADRSSSLATDAFQRGHRAAAGSLLDEAIDAITRAGYVYSEAGRLRRAERAKGLLFELPEDAGAWKDDDEENLEGVA